jgi:chromosome segregation ATPase
MILRYSSLILFSLVLILKVAPAGADEEDLMNESDAAAAQTAGIQKRLANEKAQAQASYAAAKRAHDQAVSERQKAADRLQKSQDEIEDLNADQAKLVKDTERLKTETSAIEKTIATSQTNAEKARADLATLKQLHVDAAHRFLDLATQRDKVVRDAEDLEKQVSEAQQELDDQKAREKQVSEDLDKRKTEFARKQAQMQAKITSLRERYQQSHSKVLEMQAENARIEDESNRLQQQTKTGESEVEQVEAKLAAPAQAESAGIARDVSSVDSGAGALVLKHNCRVFDAPKKGAKVLGVRQGGTAISKTDEGRTWVAFTVDGGGKGFLAKSCF